VLILLVTLVATPQPEMKTFSEGMVTGAEPSQPAAGS